MKWSSSVSRNSDLDRAMAEACAAVRADLDCAPDLAVIFVSAHHARRYERVPRTIREQLSPQTMIGCSAGGVIGGGHELEEEPGFSLTAAVLPDVRLVGFHAEDVDSPVPSPSGSPDFLLVADPFSFPVEAFVSRLDAEFPQAKKIGGLASGGRGPGENALFLDARIHRNGLIGIALAGNIHVDTLVAQGCRPIGQPMFVTRAQTNAIFGLDGRAPLEVLQELYESLPPKDRELFGHSLFLGVVMKDKSEVYRQGDFLIRNLVGLDEKRGVLLVGALIGEGTIVQFHLRDAETSAADLRELLSALPVEVREGVKGSLLFSCLGRGRHLYGRPDHDTDSFRSALGDVPLGGFFCNGEIGPVHGTTFLHGYTSSFGLFRKRS